MTERVLVTWIDAYSIDAWKQRETLLSEAKDMMLVETTGWLIDENDKYIVVAHSVGAGDMVCGAMIIPLGMVQKIKRYKR
jgi:fructose-1-phosphate kinase PfkB-like protein